MSPPMMNCSPCLKQLGRSKWDFHTRYPATSRPSHDNTWEYPKRMWQRLLGSEGEKQAPKSLNLMPSTDKPLISPGLFQLTDLYNLMTSTDWLTLPLAYKSSALAYIDWPCLALWLCCFRRVDIVRRSKANSRLVFSAAAGLSPSRFHLAMSVVIFLIRP